MLKRTLLSLLPCAAMLAAVFTENFDNGLNTWGRWNAPANKVSYEFDKNEGCAAPGCALIRFNDGNDPSKSSVFIRRFAGLEAGTYIFSAKCKAIGGDDVTATLAVQSGKNTEKDGKTTWVYQAKLGDTSKKVSVDQWRTISVVFVLEDGIVPQLLPGAKGPAGCGCLFDDITLEKIDFTKGYKDAFDCNAWNIWKANPKDKISMLYTDDEGHLDKGAVAIEYQESNPAHKSVCLLRRFPVRPGQEYNFLVFVKAVDLPDNMKVSLSIQAQDMDNQFLGIPPLRTLTTAGQCREWKRLVLTYRIPTTGKWEKCANILVTMGGTSTQKGILYFDDFQFFPSQDED